MTKVIVAMEALGIVMLLIVLYGLMFESRLKDRKSELFTACVILSLFTLGSDIISWYYDGEEEMFAVLSVTNLLAITLGMAVTAVFGFYELEMINQKRRRKKKKTLTVWVAVIPAVFNALGMIHLCYGYFQGKVFTVYKGWFQPGEWYSISFMVAAISMAYSILLVLINCGSLGAHDTGALLAYSLLPALASVAELQNSELSVTLTAMAVAELLLYVLLQAGRVEELQMRGQILREISNTDSLTGLQNRRSYDRALEKAAAVENLGVLFCDVNRLKYTNDTMGHKAGDELLLRFSELLRRNFSLDCLYRISGDEFVVIVGGLAKEGFDARVEKFRQANLELNELASIGAAHGAGTEIIGLVKDAEQDMYRVKAEFYVRYPQFKR